MFYDGDVRSAGNVTILGKYHLDDDHRQKHLELHEYSVTIISSVIVVEFFWRERERMCVRVCVRVFGVCSWVHACVRVCMCMCEN